MNKMIKKIIVMLITAFSLTSCGTTDNRSNENASYTSITAAEAKAIMDTEENYIILDVRTEEEFADGHIPGAILIPHNLIDVKAEGTLPDKDQLILVYCRSGNRSKKASSALMQLEYTNIKEFGGIIDWPYEITK